MEESKAAELHAVHGQFVPLRNGLTFLAGYVALESVNRVGSLLAMPYWKRGAIVVASAILAAEVVEPIFWLTTGNSQLQQLMVGQPVFD